MAKTKPRRPGPRPQAGAPARPIGRWIAYGVVGAFVVLIVAVMLNTPADVPEGIPEGTELVVVNDRNHVAGPIAYDRAVPAGGNHNEVPLRCGIYDQPVPVENVVHSLEHGAVWITYRPEIGSGAVNTLENASRTRDKTVLSPVPDQTAPVMVTAWGWQLQLQDVGDVKLRQFIQQFEGAPTAPEPATSCRGGIGSPTG